MKACRHCANRIICRPRGLCWTCYYTPGVKDLYPLGSANPATAKFVARDTLGTSVPDGGTLPLPPTPTRAPPGTRAKVAVMVRRARQRLALFHPADVREDSR